MSTLIYTIAHIYMCLCDSVIRCMRIYNLVIQVHKAKVLDVPIVSEEFLWDSIKEGKIIDHKKYLIADAEED